MGSSFDGTIKSHFKSAGVPRFRKMGVNAAINVVDRLKNSFPLEGKNAELTIELANRKYKEALDFLGQTLPGKILGVKFDRLECKLLDQLSSEEALSLFIQFGNDTHRAFNMWHNYYKYDNVKAVKLLDILANEDIKNKEAKKKDLKLLRTAYSGNLWGRLLMPRMETSMASNIFKIIRGNESYLPISLVKLESPVIMHAIRELDLGTISDLFIKRFVREGNINATEISALRYMLKSLGNKKAYDLYVHLVKNKIIEASEGMYKQFFDEADLLHAKDGHIPGHIIASIQERIEIDRLNRAEQKAHRSMLWRLLHSRQS